MRSLVEVDGGDVVFEHAVVGGVRELEAAQVVLVALGPVGLAVVAVAEPAQQGEQPGFGAAEVIDGIGAGAAEVADGFVDRVGDVDGDEVVGAEDFGELGGVALVGLDPVAGTRGDQRRGDDIATDAHLQKPPGDPEAASAGLVADVQVGEPAVLLLGDAAHGALQGVLGGGDAAVLARLGVATAFQDGDDGLFFMHIESDVECACRV